MLKEITIGTAQKLTSPNPFALLTAGRPDGGVNVMAVSWWTYASNHPPVLAVCLSKKGYSGGCIQREGTFTLSVVGEALRHLLRPGCGQGRPYVHPPHDGRGFSHPLHLRQPREFCLQAPRRT